MTRQSRVAKSAQGTAVEERKKVETRTAVWAATNILVGGGGLTNSKLLISSSLRFVNFDLFYDIQCLRRALITPESRHSLRFIAEAVKTDHVRC